MSTQNLPPINHFIQPSLIIASSLMGLLGISGGIYGLTNPRFFATTLGIPFTMASPSASTDEAYISFIAARNLGSGFALLTLLATGQRKAVGTVLMTGVVVAWVDAWICGMFWKEEKGVEVEVSAEDKAKEKEGKVKARNHAIMGAGFGLLGLGMWWVN
ncbi:hypothetical protein EG329_013910 [Mollisiaceae sp. DMI_Dod_QoI]|nr:hypothetical protein EG329_013910 [Helotiales sp. DMI_Dod_QoI]